MDLTKECTSLAILHVHTCITSSIVIVAVSFVTSEWSLNIQTVIKGAFSNVDEFGPQ